MACKRILALVTLLLALLAAAWQRARAIEMLPPDFDEGLRQRPVWAAWALVGLVFLVLWSTRWAQYLLLVLPLCGSGAWHAASSRAGAEQRYGVTTLAGHPGGVSSPSLESIRLHPGVLRG